ncbi:hypothetical protein [Spirosoma oryzicola]|uniref:hypothetical protein n=1 Tax=Spirosoma oryzicola TaxID=2898794 RepID=UPI001E2B36F5|nr:hypothetical protein [Spirosoma oryzicola]UHG92953.1 hypothetical protein LQ777_08630 [Spirosoma oryzicola]
MANEKELTGMHLFKSLQDRQSKGQSMSPEEREWFEAQKKGSLKHRIRIEGGGCNRDQNYGSER